MQKSLLRTPLWLALFATSAALAQAAGTPAYERKDAVVHRAAVGQALGRAVGNNHADVVAAVLRARGRGEASVAGLREAGVTAGRDGVTHRRLEQTVEGLTVHGAYAKAAFTGNGELTHLIDHLAAVPAAALAPARVSAQQALQAAMARLHPSERASFAAAGANGNRQQFNGGAFFHTAPTVEAVAVPHSDGSMSRGWLVQTWTQRTNQLHHTLVGGDGRVLDVESRTANDSYNVFAIDPGKGPQGVVNGPGTGTAQSPSGWLGSGTQTTFAINGNNVSTYLDADANNRADKGGTTVSGGNFLASASLGTAPTTTTNKAVAVQNLFYLNNVIHDRLHRHGFNEAAGNFQSNNFGLGGAGNDAVNAEAQDGSGTDNANFATPADGQKPRMQMYLWTGAGTTHEVIVGATGYGAMGAQFGPALTTTGVSGAIVRATPADGCTVVSAAVSGKVALIDRGSCDFVTKVLNAQSAGATAVIVANNAGGTDTFTMGGTSRSVRIASVMVSQNDSATLKGLANPSGTLRKKAVQPLQIDASLDSDIVYHEYCHGLTWRMIGGMSGPIAGAIGEGMGDGCAMLINGDDKMGEYSASSANGIRRYPYGSYALTYANVTGAEVHDDGEIYAAIVWSLITRFDATYGAAGRDRLFNYVVDGMNFTPATPKFEDMRSGILQSIGGPPGSADRCLVWGAFAQYGVGTGSSAIINSSTSVTTSPSFSRGEGCP